MLTNYFLTAFRALARQRLHVLINVAGLAVGLAAALLVITYVRFETSYDEFQPAVASTWRMGVVALDVPVDAASAYAPVVALEVAKSMPEVTDVLALFPWAPGRNAERGEIVRAGEQELRLRNHYAATANLTQFVRVDLVAGDLHRVLTTPDQIALSRAEATRLFGTTDAVGRQLIRANGSWTVAAVFEDLPANTHYDFQSLSSAERVPDNFAGYAYVRLRQGTDLGVLAKKIGDIVSGRSFYPMGVSFHAVSDLHLATNGNRSAVNIAIALSAVLIAIAALNFVNLSTALAGRRTREIGVRKALGASRVRVVAQYLVESVIVALVAGLLAAILAELALPWFNTLVNRDLQLALIGDAGLVLLATTLLVGFAAGLYPAFFLSSVGARNALNGELVGGATGVKVRKALFVVQAALSAALTVAALVLLQQMHYLQQLPTGYAKTQRLEVRGIDAKRAYATADPAFLAEFERIPGVSAATLFDRSLTEDSASVIDVVLPGTTRAITSGFTGASYGFVETLGLELLAGRDFAREYAGDWYREDVRGIGHASVVITESMSKTAGFATPNDALGEQLRLDIYGTENDPLVTVVGVVSDIKLGSVSRDHRPIFFICGFTWARSTSIVLKLTNTNAGRVRADVERVLQERLAMSPAATDIRLTEEQYRAIYSHESGQARLVRIFATLAIFLSCIGSFGLAAFSAQQRRREFAIRRIQGASRMSLVNLLLNEYMVLICWSALLAFPVAYAWLSAWLSNFSERIEQTPAPYALALILLCAVIWLASSGLAFRAARVRPSEALRYE